MAKGKQEDSASSFTRVDVQKWQYRWEVVDCRSTRKLNQLGDEGWRVVLGFLDISRHEVRLLLERSLKETNDV